jgi:hypothetical protein
MHSCHATTGQESPIAIVASTLLVTGLFPPLRGFLQRSVDQRFYYANYDVEQTLTALRARLLHEVSVPDLQFHLIEVVRETMQPTHLSI